MTDFIDLTIELPNGAEETVTVGIEDHIDINNPDGTILCRVLYEGADTVRLKIFSTFPEDELDYARGLDDPPSQM